MVLGAAPALADPTGGAGRPPSQGYFGWQVRASTDRSAADANQGIATLTVGDGVGRVITRGNADLTDRMIDLGWVHIGDPDATGRYILDAYQGAADARTKLFVPTAPDATTHWLVHHLVAGSSTTIRSLRSRPAPSGSSRGSGTR
jgi:hypothetical protein